VAFGNNNNNNNVITIGTGLGVAVAGGMVLANPIPTNPYKMQPSKKRYNVVGQTKKLLINTNMAPTAAMANREPRNAYHGWTVMATSDFEPI
jgi:hypothetical protein